MTGASASGYSAKGARPCPDGHWMKLLILGGGGFIGTHVVDALLDQGHSLRVFSRRGEMHRDPLPGIDYRIADLADTAALVSALDGCDAVLHLITATHPASAERDPRADVEGNLLGSLQVLQAMQTVGVTRLLYLSSGGVVYGVPDTLPIPERHALRPIASYGIVKAAIERYIAVATQKGVRAAVIRPANIYGPRQTHTANPGFITTALLRLAQDEPLPIFGDGLVVRDYLHVRDLAELCLLTLAADETLTLNAGSGHGLTLLEVAGAIERVTGRTLRLQFIAARPIDVPVSVLDCSLAKSRLGWTPRVALEEGLAETWDWVRSQG